MNFVHIHEIKFRLLTTYSFRSASLVAVWGFLLHPKRGWGSGREPALNRTVGYDTLADQTTEKDAPSERSCPFSNSLLKAWPQVVENSHWAASQLRTVCVCFPIGNSKGQRKDWINLNFTAARLQWALCVCLYYYLSGRKRPSAFTCPWKDERNNAAFNFGSDFKSIPLWFFFLWKRQFDNFWHRLTSTVMLFLKLK